MVNIELKNISNYNCKNINLSIEDGEMMVLIGQTGAGKTTILNVISGLAPYEGSVYFNGTCMDNISPAKRDVGYLFQSFALFPNLTVRENISFGLEVKDFDKNQINKRVNELISLLGIEHITHRYPKGLSGGEKQRVAFARTLATNPKILLLDEPFSNLDPRTANILRNEMRNLQKELNITTIFVTHNQKEAFELADRVAVIKNGIIEQVSKPMDILFNPQTQSVHHLLGSPTILKCDKIKELDFGLAKVTCGSLSLIVINDGKPFDKVAILSHEIRLSKYPIDSVIPNKFKAKLIDITIVNKSIVQIVVEAEETKLTIELSKTNWNQLGIGISENIHIAIPFGSIITPTK
ncbi:MAG: ABC transporter ATP-binding protein [Sulfurimonas sp.]|nr:ABC transporter ATP-binding protein [Sulfurimonas sp.]